MGELAANATQISDVTGPGNRHALRRPTEVRCPLLRPLERGVHRPRPLRRIVWECPFRSPERIPEKLVLHRYFNAIERGELVRGAVDHAFGARAVVATDIDDQGVVEFAEIFNGLEGVESHFALGATTPPRAAIRFKRAVIL